MNLRQKQREAAIEAILESAVTVFAEHGYHGASMEDLARACNCAPATLYGYFKGKRPLFVAMSEKLMTSFGEGAAAAILQADSYEAGLDAFLEHFITFGNTNRDLIQVVISLHRAPETGTAPDPEQARCARIAYTDLVASLMQRGVDEGHLAEADPKILAVCFLGLVHSAAVTHFLDERTDPLRPDVTFAANLFRRGAAPGTTP